jgi:hypothetical protein
MIDPGNKSRIVEAEHLPTLGAYQNATTIHADALRPEIGSEESLGHSLGGFLVSVESLEPAYFLYGPVS